MISARHPTCPYVFFLRFLLRFLPLICFLPTLVVLSDLSPFVLFVPFRALLGFERGILRVLPQGFLKHLKEDMRSLCPRKRGHAVEDEEGNPLQAKL
jgi:hypothetical protein